MGEMPDDRDMGDVSPAKSVDRPRLQKSPSQASSPSNGSENGRAFKKEQAQSTRESTMSDISMEVKGEKSEASSETDQKSGRGSAAAKNSRRGPPLFNHLPSATEDATKTFQVIETSIYTSKYLGDSGQDEVMSCDCRPSWSGSTNHACDEDSDCINRLTSMECVGPGCGCGNECQNQRFQRKQYANVDVILTEKKGYGIRINSDTPANTFIYEYVGEVIDEAKFRRRTEQYAKEGIKHFYFMSLGKSEFIDATKKGGLGRFCNHSCNPNCYVDKWVVGDKLRMGIFAKRDLKASEELVFDYNVDRYGANPQACFCGEPNCIGYIGGKTQTESGTKLSHQTLEALGLEDTDGWETATARKKKPKKGENDDEYTGSAQPKPLEASAVNGIMSSLISCKEKWIVIKLLNRIHASEDTHVQGRVLRLHGYSIMNNLLVKWSDEKHIVVTILEILIKWPRLTKNKISSSKIEGTVEEIDQKSDDPKIQDLTKELLESWSSLQSAYRIPRRAPGADTAPEFTFDEGRRNRDKSPSPSAKPIPKQPRNAIPQKPFNPPRGPANLTAPAAMRTPLNQPPPPLPPPIPSGHIMPSTNNAALPKGWWWHRDKRNQKYFYTSDYSKVQWNHPLDPPIAPHPALVGKKRGLDDIIQQCQEEYAETAEAKRRASLEKKAQTEASKQKEEDDKKLYEEQRRERKRKEYEAKRLKKKREDKFRNIDPALARKLIAKTHGVIAFKVADELQKRYKWKWPKEDFKILMKGFSYKLADRTIEKGGKYAELPGIEIDKEYRARIEGHVKQWMKDEKYCKKKLEVFRTEFAQSSGEESSPTGSKTERGDSQQLVSQPGSCARTDDSPMVNGLGRIDTVKGSQESTPGQVSPKKRTRDVEDDYAVRSGSKLDMNGHGYYPDESARKRAKSESPRPGSPSRSSSSLGNDTTETPITPNVTEVLKVSLPVMGTPTKRSRQDDDGYDEDVEMTDGERTEKSVKRVRSRSNSPSGARGFDDGLRRQPATVHTGA
ncbi:histone-lysine N-methyltransferase [Peziza echinospora]|nr:histone-lysine N-methyltransferase [Peziza echinospora]